MENSISIHSLCDDILVEIFSYIDTEWLIKVVRKVCNSWMYLIDHESRIWRNRWIVWDVSKPINILCSYLESAPWLVGLKLNKRYDVTSDIEIKLLLQNLKKLLCSASQIRKLEINFSVTIDILHSMHKNMRCLYVKNICRQDYSVLKRFKKIETLEFGNAYDFCGRHLRLIADKCYNLKKLSMRDCRSLYTSDVIYFLQKRKCQIESLEINGYGMSDEVFISISQCENLKELKVHDCRLLSYPTLVKIFYSQVRILFLSRLRHRCTISIEHMKLKLINLNYE